ncbi:MAG: hypothetical protein WCC22_06135 [Terriglobales bacterium]
MTAILGIHGFPGVLLCSDSEETIGGYSKRSVGKIVDFRNDAFHFAIGAAGAGHYADMLTEEMLRKLYQLPLFSSHAISSVLSQILLDFHQKHVWPRCNADSMANAAVEFIVVAQPLPSGEVEIFHTCETSVLRLGAECDGPGNTYVSIGIGKHLADYILGRIYESSGGEEHLLATGIFTITQVIENIAEVGKEPFMILFRHDGTRRIVDPTFIAEMSRYLTECAERHKQLFQYLTDAGDTERTFFKFEELAKSIYNLREQGNQAAKVNQEKDRVFQEWLKRSNRSLSS